MAGIAANIGRWNPSYGRRSRSMKQNNYAPQSCSPKQTGGREKVVDNILYMGYMAKNCPTSLRVVITFENVHGSSPVYFSLTRELNLSFVE